MFTVKIHGTGGHSITCTSPVTGATLLRIFACERLVLSCVQPLKNRSVSRDGGSYHLAEYEAVHNSRYESLARITLA